MKKLFFAFCGVLFFATAALQVFIFRQNYEIKKYVVAHCEKITVFFEDVKLDIQSLSESQLHGIAEVQESLAYMKKSADAQFSETAGMKQTYEAVLSEQKKKTVDMSAKDSAIFRMKTEAETYFSLRNFSAAYESYKKVLLYQADDLESRRNKMKSLYYMNRADSSKYPEILEDIRILKAAGHSDAESLEIEAAIRAEQEGIYE